MAFRISAGLLEGSCCTEREFLYGSNTPWAHVKWVFPRLKYSRWRSYCWGHRGSPYLHCTQTWVHWSLGTGRRTLSRSPHSPAAPPCRCTRTGRRSWTRPAASSRGRRGFPRPPCRGTSPAPAGRWAAGTTTLGERFTPLTRPHSHWINYKWQKDWPALSNISWKQSIFSPAWLYIIADCIYPRIYW